jgi:hypothetical protein
MQSSVVTFAGTVIAAQVTASAAQAARLEAHRR